MSASTSEDEDQSITINVDHVDVEGDTFQKFVEAFETSAKEVRKFKYARLFYTVLALVAIALFVAEMLSVYGGSVVAPFFPGVETQSDFSYAPYGPIFGVIAITVAYRIYSYSKSLDVNTTRRSYYLLADSIEHYRNNEYEMSLDCLEDLVQSTNPRGDSSFHTVRYYQMKEYLEQLNAAKKEMQLADAMEGTYSDVFEPICAEIILFSSENNPVNKVIDEMDYISEEYHPAIEVLIDSFSQINLPNKSRIFVISATGVVAMVIGFTFGTQWAVLLLTIYMIYAGSGINSE